jgi:hypothetical protein
MIPLVGLAVAGCSSYPYTEEPLSSPEPPPVECAEIPAPPETPGQLWIPGRWVRGEDAWRWQPGRYVQPSGEDDFWVPGSWKKNADSGAWEYAPGAWVPVRVRKAEEPPAPEPEEPAAK